MATTPTPAPTETVKQISFDQAFEKAKAEFAPEAPIEEAVKPSAETTHEETEQQPAEETGTEPAQTPEGSEEELLSKEEFGTLKGNPEALRKAYNRAYTQNRQKYKPYERLITAFETDPAGTLEKLADAQGFVLQRPGEPEQPAQATSQTVEELKASLGPELEFLAEKLGPAVEKLMNQRLAPVQREIQLQGVMRKAEGAMSELAAKHKDWKQFEPKIVQFAKIFQPAIGPDGQPLASQEEYLESLYTLASLNRSSAETTKRVVAKITKAVENAESPESGVAPSRVAPKPSGIPSFEEAFAAAKAGVRWES